MMLRPIPGSRVTKQVQEQVAAFVSAHQFQVGDKLPSLREFTETLGVSRPSVREGLRALEALGIIEIKHGSGIFVASGMPPITQKSGLIEDGVVSGRVAREILAVRLAVEPAISSLAALRASDADLVRLTGHVKDFRRDFGKIDNPPSDIAFHIDLCRATHNNGFMEIMKWISQFYAKDAKRPQERDVDDHARILEAVRQRDAKGARAEMTRHLNWIGRVLDKRLRKSGAEHSARGRK
jgi:GntR family transcriptional regulator, transcriptional repressor for pyruvate dehydrogenase complex